MAWLRAMEAAVHRPVPDQGRVEARVKQDPAAVGLEQDARHRLAEPCPDVSPYTENDLGSSSQPRVSRTTLLTPGRAALKALSPTRGLPPLSSHRGAGPTSGSGARPRPSGH